MDINEKNNGNDICVGSIENSIEEDIKILEEFKTNGYPILLMKYGDRIKTNFKLGKAIEHILSDYKRVLKENEELEEINNELEAEKNEAIRRYNFETIPIKKVKDKIEELNKQLEEDLQDEIKVNSNRFIIICQCKNCLQELLESEK